jgi:uncharacterized protein GlcG (DUF336 family)
MGFGTLSLFVQQCRVSQQNQRHFGAIGVSSGTVEQDQACAQAALEAIG